MIKLLPTCILLLLVTTCNQNAQHESQISTTKANTAHIERIEKSLYPIYNLKGEESSKSIPQMMEENKITGVSIAFVNNGEIAWTECYGYADFEDSLKVTSNTIFRAASLSKPLTAMAALHLVEEGILELDEDVNQKLKGWKLPENQFTTLKKVTLSNIIGHTSGVKNAVHPGYPTEEVMPTNEEILSGTKLNMPGEIVSVPGEKYKYSNVGYMVLSELLMDVTSKGFDELMKEIIFQPCGMESSTFEQNVPEEFKEHLAEGYDRDQEPVSFYQHPSVGAGALWSTPSDLGKFLAAIMGAYHQMENKRIISNSMAKKVFEEGKPKLGFNKYQWNGNFVFRNDGSIPGYNCFLMGSLNNNQAVVVMLNTNSDKAYDFLNYLWRAVAMEYDWGLFEPNFYERREIPTRELKNHTGLYLANGDSASFSVVNDNLVVDSRQTGSQNLVPIGNSSFLLPTVPMRYNFKNDSTGVIKSLSITNERGDSRQPYQKIY